MKTKKELIESLLDLSFAEDVGDGDHTTLSTIPEDAMGRSRLIIKEPGMLSGVDYAIRTLKKVDPEVEIETYIEDGSEVKPGDIAFVARGRVRSLLIAERTLLNIMQRMSGVAISEIRGFSSGERRTGHPVPPAQGDSGKSWGG